MKILDQLVPIVIEQTPRGERAYDIYSRLLQDRIVLLGFPLKNSDLSAFSAPLLLRCTPPHIYRI